MAFDPLSIIRVYNSDFQFYVDVTLTFTSTWVYLLWDSNPHLLGEVTIHSTTITAQIRFRLCDHKKAGLISPLLHLACADQFCPHWERCLLQQASVLL